MPFSVAKELPAEQARNSTDRSVESKAKAPVRKLSVFEFRRSMSFGAKLGLGLAAWGLFVLSWHLFSVSGLADPTLFPSPARVLEAWILLFAEKDFALDVAQSLKRIFSSFGIALAIALPLGIMMGVFTPVGSFFNALVSPFRYLPAPSFVPLLLMWLGTGEEQKVALLVIGVVFFLTTLFMDNTRAVPMELVESSRTLGVKKLNVVWRVVLPSALPSYVDTARQMLAVSWTYLVIAEIVAATDGIGAMMMRAKRFVQVDSIMAGILTIGLLGLLSDLLIRLIYRASFRYLKH
ncbi:ABC transporter permease [Haloferula sp.]|jgi:NitT/TauT family transport system permease protein|uniref:ABC transporter permease n=1 Tax=Haloferula sp. TaxID=2497595 RepID=UPI003C729769